jgi:type IV pilus assembly protein PilC
MSNYSYEAVDASGLRKYGSLEVLTQSEAIRRIKEMGLYPLAVKNGLAPRQALNTAKPKSFQLPAWMTERRIKSPEIMVFTRQLATLLDAGLPLLRGLRLLQEQEENRSLKRIIGEMGLCIESGGNLSEALAAHPKVFSPLFVNMAKAGETGGILELVLKRQAQFMEKAHNIKGRVKTAMFYPAAVMLVAAGIITLLMTFVIPRFQSVFDGLLNGKPMPAFTVAVLNISAAFKDHFLVMGATMLVVAIAFRFFISTTFGRHWFDRFKLSAPVCGKVCRKISLAHFSRTLGTLLGSGVPVLQALNIVKETTGNVIVSDMVSKIHDSVKQGGVMAEPMKASRVFPVMVSGMVDVGEQTGALPEMLLKIADTSDEEVDNAVTAMTSMLEPVMIVFLAVIVGSIVIAMFLPLIKIMEDPTLTGGGGEGS